MDGLHGRGLTVGEERSDVRGGEREREPERGGVRETERVRTRRDRQGTGARMTSAAAEPLAATQAEQEPGGAAGVKCVTAVAGADASRGL